jgi:carbamoyl-phosphate synthase large subunit
VHKSDLGIISSGYTQGFIRYRPDLCIQAEAMAKALDSRGPINIQGRVKNGRFIPFEINPRFSASTHLRTLAGFDELNVYLQHLITKRTNFPVFGVSEGYCVRSFTEKFIPKEQSL